jgi:hypothetical protein
MDNEKNITIFINGELINLNNTSSQKLENLLKASKEKNQNLNDSLNSLLISMS